MPKVSVIIPVYKVEQYIERCARSLFEQTLDDIEYLFVDDCSPDMSIEILKQVLEEYPWRKQQVIIHRMECNSGQAKVREWGMGKASGEYVIHCDSDDWVEKDMYETLYRTAKEKDGDIVICGFSRIDGKRVFFQGASYSHVAGDKRQLLSLLIRGSNLSSLCNKLVSRELCSKLIYPTSNMWEDYVISVQLLYYARRVVSVDRNMYWYCYNPRSICGTKDARKVIDRYLQQKENVEMIINFLRDHGIYDMYSDDVVGMKYLAKSELLPAVGEIRYWNLWRKEYKEINGRILFSRAVPLRGKIKFIITFLGLYPLISKTGVTVLQ